MTNEILAVTKGKTSIGLAHFPNRKKPQLCVFKPGGCQSFGVFRSEKDAIDFMHELADFCGAKVVDDD